MKRKRTVKRIKLILPVLFVVIFLTVLAGSSAYRHYIDFFYPLKYEDIIENNAGKRDLPVSLLLSVIKTESRFDPLAVSNRNAKGLMQITDDTFNWITTKLPEEERENIEDIFDPRVNIKYGSFFLRYLYDEFQSWPVALAAYNAGRTRIRGWLVNPEYSNDGESLHTIPYKETREYIEKVRKAKEKYEGLYPYTAGQD